MLPGVLLSLGLDIVREDNGVSGDRPIGSGIKGESWDQGGVKEEDDYG